MLWCDPALNSCLRDHWSFWHFKSFLGNIFRRFHIWFPTELVFCSISLQHDIFDLKTIKGFSELSVCLSDGIRVATAVLHILLRTAEVWLTSTTLFSRHFAMRIAARSRPLTESPRCWRSRSQLHSSWKTLTWSRAKPGAAKTKMAKIQPLELSRSSSWHFELEFERMFLKLESPVATGSVWTLRIGHRADIGWWILESLFPVSSLGIQVSELQVWCNHLQPTKKNTCHFTGPPN